MFDSFLSELIVSLLSLGEYARIRHWPHSRCATDKTLKFPTQHVCPSAQDKASYRLEPSP
jgi:hypothetical protein